MVPNRSSTRPNLSQNDGSMDTKVEMIFGMRAAYHDQRWRQQPRSREGCNELYN